MDVNKVVDAYLNIRGRIGELNEQIEALKSQQAVLEEALLKELSEQNCTSISTNSGTVIKQTKSRFFSNDWPAFKRWARENDALDLFESRLHQGNTKEWMNTNPTNVPPGLQSAQDETITIRKK